MKAWSKANSLVPPGQVREAKERRKDFLKHGRFCRGFYRYKHSTGFVVTQLDDSPETIAQSAQSAGASGYYWFAGSLEAYLDGEPYEEHSL